MRLSVSKNAQDAPEKGVLIFKQNCQIFALAEKLFIKSLDIHAEIVYNYDREAKWFKIPYS